MSAMIHALANYLRNHQPTCRPANLTNGKSAVINPVSPRIETYTEGGSDKPPEQKHSVRIMSPPWDRLHGAQHRHMSSQSPSFPYPSQIPGTPKNSSNIKSSPYRTISTIRKHPQAHHRTTPTIPLGRPRKDPPGRPLENPERSNI